MIKCCYCNGNYLSATGNLETHSTTTTLHVLPNCDTIYHPCLNIGIISIYLMSYVCLSQMAIFLAMQLLVYGVLSGLGWSCYETCSKNEWKHFLCTGEYVKLQILSSPPPQDVIMMSNWQWWSKALIRFFFFIVMIVQFWTVISNYHQDKVSTWNDGFCI